MSRWYGKVGFVSDVEKTPGVYVQEVTERNYYGDVTQNISRWESGTSINDNVNINNQISILADPYIYEHFSEMKYVEFMGAKWKINSVTVERPRLTLAIGGLYNGQ